MKTLFKDKNIGYHTLGLRLKDVKYNSELNNHYHDYSKDYLTFEALEDGNIYFKYQEWSPIETQRYMEYSKDGGETWVRTTNVDNEEVVMTIPLTAGETALVRGDNDTLASYNEDEEVYFASHFYSDIEFNVYGNIMSLTHGDTFISETTMTEYMFYALFFDSWGNYDGEADSCYVVDASNLILPATTLADYCYSNMFNGCTSLTAAPELPATVLADNCYSSMFFGCTSLTTAPELPATTLADNCYSNMFNGCTSLTTASELPAMILNESCYSGMFLNCTSLTTAPELPAIILATSCYASMFFGCTGLTTAPELSATSLASNCYNNMFNGCTSLTTAPELSATTLAEHCCINMFNGCTSLTTAPELSATTLADYCYYDMFTNCTALTTSPELPAMILANGCYVGMFKGCTNLNYIKAMFTTTPSSEYTHNWVNGVSSSGTFVKNSVAIWDVTGNNGIPEGWTVETVDE